MNQIEFFQKSEEINNAVVGIARSIGTEDEKRDALLKPLKAIFDQNNKSLKAYNVSIGSKHFSAPDFDELITVRAKLVPMDQWGNIVSQVAKTANSLSEEKVTSSSIEKPIKMLNWEKKESDKKRFSKMIKSVDEFKEVLEAEVDSDSE